LASAIRGSLPPHTQTHQQSSAQNTKTKHSESE